MYYFPVYYIYSYSNKTVRKTATNKYQTQMPTWAVHFILYEIMLLTNDDEAAIYFLLGWRLLWVFTEPKETEHDLFAVNRRKVKA